MKALKSLQDDIAQAIDSLVNEGIFDARPDNRRIVIEIPRDASHGDITTNAAMVLSKEARMNPRDLANIILKKISSLDDVKTGEIAGPGFINLWLDSNFWLAQMGEILRTGTAYGDSNIGAGEQSFIGKVNFVTE